MTPEQEALYALQWNVPRSELSMAAQIDYDRLRPAWERGEDRPTAEEVETARLAWEQERSEGYAGPVNGETVTDTLFWKPPSDVPGYDARQVDDLLRRVAAEIDAGRSAAPLIENATFNRRKYRSRYDIEAVDWFLGQVLLAPDRLELAGTGVDPWRDILVAQFAPGGVSGLAKRSPHAKPTRAEFRAYFASRCGNAWRDFDRLSGIRLRWEDAGRAVSELRIGEQQTLASVSGSRRKTFTASGRSFTFRPVSAASSPGWGSAGEVVLPHLVRQDVAGHYAGANTRGIRSSTEELVDETGIAILYASGSNFNWRATASIMFRDQRELRFLVRGSRLDDAIMTAVDQAGNAIARYRSRIIVTSRHPTWYRSSKRVIDVTVHPDWELTDQRALAIAVSAPWLGSYFVQPSGGG
jgi:hypothetical protein